MECAGASNHRVFCLGPKHGRLVGPGARLVGAKVHTLAHIQLVTLQGGGRWPGTQGEGHPTLQGCRAFPRPEVVGKEGPNLRMPAMFISQPGPLPWIWAHKSRRLLPKRSLPISSPQTTLPNTTATPASLSSGPASDDIPDSSISLTACIQASANPTFSFAHLSVFMRR